MGRKGWVLFIALSVMWGVPYLMIRVAVRDLDPIVVVFGRCALGALLLLPLAVKRKALRPVLRHWKVLLIYTAVEILGPWVFIGFAETRLDSSTTGLLIAGVPLVAAIVLTIIGQDRPDLRRVIGLLIGFAGVVVLVGLDIDLHNLIAVGALALTCVGYALGPIMINRYLSDLPSIGVITLSLAIAAVVYLIPSVLLRPNHVSLASGASVVGLAVICTAAAFLTMFALIAEVGPGRMTVITYVNPAVAIILGALVLDEPLTLGLGIGFPLIIAGSILATRRTRAARGTDPPVLPADPGAACELGDSDAEVGTAKTGVRRSAGSG